MATILTFAEQRDGKLRRASLEAVSEARRLAEVTGATVECVLVGTDSDVLVTELGTYGAKRVYVFADASLSA
jgi:electron transfer flavoprotein alpha subunit